MQKIRERNQKSVYFKRKIYPKRGGDKVPLEETTLFFPSTKKWKKCRSQFQSSLNRYDLEELFFLQKKIVFFSRNKKKTPDFLTDKQKSVDSKIMSKYSFSYN